MKHTAPPVLCLTFTAERARPASAGSGSKILLKPIVRHRSDRLCLAERSLAAVAVQPSGELKLNFVSPRCKDDDGDRETRNVLLIPELLINGDEDVERASSELKKLAILFCSPTHFRNRADFMTREFTAEVPRNTLIKQ
jgi:hypothetical protein